MQVEDIMTISVHTEFITSEVTVRVIETFYPGVTLGCSFFVFSLWRTRNYTLLKESLNKGKQMKLHLLNGNLSASDSDKRIYE